MSGPYIVTVKLRCDQAACGRMEPCEAERSGWCAHPNAEDGFGRKTPVPHRAVATLNEALPIRVEKGPARGQRQYRQPWEAWGADDRYLGQRGTKADAEALAREYNATLISASGGTVGPLPDGSLVEVEALSWADLRGHAGLDRDGFTLDAQTVAAFNAKEAQGA